MGVLAFQSSGLFATWVTYNPVPLQTAQSLSLPTLPLTDSGNVLRAARQAARGADQKTKGAQTERCDSKVIVSLSESLDTATPTGRMVFTVLGAVAELERSLIAERVRVGLRNARAKGKHLGRPKVAADGRQVAALRKTGSSWSEACEQTGLFKGTAQGRTMLRKAPASLPKSRCGPISYSV